MLGMRTIQRSRPTPRAVRSVVSQNANFARTLPFLRTADGVSLLLFIAISSVAAPAAAATKAKPPTILSTHDVPGIIPAPANLVRGEGKFEWIAVVPILWHGENTKEAAALLAATLKSRYGVNCKTAALDNSNDRSKAIRLTANRMSATASEEDYGLTITTNGMSIEAHHPAGFFYAIESLLQLFDAQKVSATKTVSLPVVRIYDAPRFIWRGMMLDESRHFFGTKAVKELLDVMAYLKLNRFHWHLTDEPGWRIEIKKYPKLTEIGGQGNWSNPAGPRNFYTQDDIREIVTYAAARHITVIPEIDMPGHATAACRAYPQLSGGGVGFTFNPGMEETYRFLEDVLLEVAKLFPGPYIHIGGDEVSFGNKQWSTNPTTMKFMKEHELANAAELEHYFMRRMLGVVKKLGKMPIGWDDVAAGDVPAIVPGDVTLMWWHHEKPKRLTQLLEKSYNVILSPRHPSYFDFIQHDSHTQGRRWDGFNDLGRVYDFPDSVTQGLIPPGKDRNILGIEACLWTERVQNRDRLGFMLFPRLAAMAESAWTLAEAKNKSQFLDRLPGFLRELDRRSIPHFNPFDPQKTPEPVGPEKKAGGTANG